MEGITFTQNGPMAAKNGSQGPPRAHPRGHRGQRLGRQRKQTREESMPVRSAQRSQRALHSSQTRAGLTGLDPWPQPRQTPEGLGGTLRGRSGPGGRAWTEGLRHPPRRGPACTPGSRDSGSPCPGRSPGNRPRRRADGPSRGHGRSGGCPGRPGCSSRSCSPGPTARRAGPEPDWLDRREAWANRAWANRAWLDHPGGNADS